MKIKLIAAVAITTIFSYFAFSKPPVTCRAELVTPDGKSFGQKNCVCADREMNLYVCAIE